MKNKCKVTNTLHLIQYSHKQIQDSREAIQILKKKKRCNILANIYKILENKYNFLQKRCNIFPNKYKILENNTNSYKKIQHSRKQTEG